MSLYVIKNNFKIIEARSRWDAYQVALSYTPTPILMRVKTEQHYQEMSV